ncbi:hypothetical protein pb186bvf_013091 [Paramecium bursaria]
MRQIVKRKSLEKNDNSHLINYNLFQTSETEGQPCHRTMSSPQSDTSDFEKMYCDALKKQISLLEEKVKYQEGMNQLKCIQKICQIANQRDEQYLNLKEKVIVIEYLQNLVRIGPIQIIRIKVLEPWKFVTAESMMHNKQFILQAIRKVYHKIKLPSLKIRPYESNHLILV